jgi:LmbE family N-acetylglucosaminyl deacetylase
VLGAAHRESLGLPDARLAAVPEHKDPVVAALRRLRPRLVLLQHWEQRHPDHAAASRIVYDAAFLAGLRNYRPDLGPAFRPVRLLYALATTEAGETPPALVVDVTAYWETKLRAISAFASQFAAAPGETVSLPFERFRQNVELAGRRHGQRIGVDYGEGFATREPIAVEDLLAFGGSSF